MTFHPVDTCYEMVNQRSQEKLPVEGSDPMALKKILKKENGDDRTQEKGILHGRVLSGRSDELQIAIKDTGKSVH